MTTEEIWKPVAGYEGLYEVSSLGRVRSLDRIVIPRTGRGKGVPYTLPGKILKPSERDTGHLKVWLSNGEAKVFYVHRLVLIAFIGLPEEGQEGCHWDGDPQNNEVSNLRWGTASENRQDSLRHGTHAQVRKTHCPRGHALEEPNLKKGEPRRSCLSCSRERNLAASQHREFNLDFANRRYENLMKGGSGLWIDI